MNNRLTWDEYFLKLVFEIGQRSTCDRGKTAAIFVKDNRILSTGYAGSPKGFPHCDEAGHQLKKSVDYDGVEREHCIRTVHAEQNGIVQAARFGISLEGSTVYCQMEPCRTCAMLLINLGIVRFVCNHRYRNGQESREMLQKANITLDILELIKE